ncbi:MAG: DMT family transporter [Pseudomonadota bacterium]
MGVLWMIVAGVLFATMGVCVKIGAQYFSSAELVFYRSAIGLAVLLPMIRLRRLPLATHNWRGHAWRGLSGFAALALFFYCIGTLPLATAVTLNYTAPLFLALLTVILLKQHPPALLWLALALGFVGVVVLLRPSVHPGQAWSVLLGLVSGLLAGVALFNVKQLGMAGEPEWRVVFYFTLICTLGGGLGMLTLKLHPVGWRQLPLLAALGASATLAQLAMTRAYHTGKTLVVGSFAYSTVVFASLFGVLLWDEVLPPSGWLAIAMIAGGGLLSLKARPSDEAAAAPGNIS